MTHCRGSCGEVVMVKMFVCVSTGNVCFFCIMCESLGSCMQVRVVDIICRLVQAYLFEICLEISLWQST